MEELPKRIDTEQKATAVEAARNVHRGMDRILAPFTLSVVEQKGVEDGCLVWMESG